MNSKERERRKKGEVAREKHLMRDGEKNPDRKKEVGTDKSEWNYLNEKQDYMYIMRNMEKNRHIGRNVTNK